jgi:hypothetical protein
MKPNTGQASTNSDVGKNRSAIADNTQPQAARVPVPPEFLTPNKRFERVL